ncbi:Serine aminopeptidase, S33-type [Desulfonema limicola]|uniref:Serine aminopeptidase, S33-type n=1 Tax=Desulfonema limicola TaxID=45656 RepID=A0A975GGL3_9BACT|nr:alpha/beta fold hydrolase [Desulfonema limicola]QTA80368.1 Serine aminopeptidase, S33-type [Desulfonema limicola]
MAPPEIESIQEEVSFSSDDFLLKGTLHLPKNIEEPPVVVGSHGLFSSSHSPKQVELARACNAQGIAFFRFDHRGCGESEGKFKEVTSLNSRCADLKNAVNFIRERKELGSKTGLFGSSMGGAVCLFYAKQAGGVDAVIINAAPLRGEPIIKALQEEGDEKKAFSSLNLQFNISEKIAGINRILIFHGDSDKIISPSEAHRIYQKAVMPKRLIMLKNGDHEMSLKENQEKFIRESVLWYKSMFKEENIWMRQ